MIAGLRSPFALATATLAIAVPQIALAQDQNADPPAREDDASADDFHVDKGIVVTAPYVRDLNILAGTSQISADELVREMRGQIGDTLTKLPGVSATAFAPGASRPVLRGFQGDRIRVLTDGIGAIDVSNVSADHAVTVDALTIDRIEVLRGPAVLLFGGQAIGGAVNAIDKRIPRNIPEEPVHIDAVAGYSTAYREGSAGISLDAPLGNRLVGHLDASWRDSGNLRVGGFTLSPELRAQQLEIAEEETAEGNLEEAAEALELAGLRGIVPNTAARTVTLGGGLAFIDAGGNLGLSVQHYDTRYGIPARPGVGHGGEEEGGEEGEAPVSIDLQQLRVDFRGEVAMRGFAEALRLRAAYVDYEHTEFEGDEVGTLFTQQGIEARAELVQRDRNGWKGASGIQFVTRDFSAVGAEAFVPPSLTNSFGVFTLQEIKMGALDIELAGRFDRTNHRAQQIDQERRFNAYSGAVGLGYTLVEGLKAGINLAHSERAPSTEELFSNGPHIATQAFELGDPTFRKERSNGGELYLRYNSDTIDASITAYYSDFDGFISEIPTGDEEDGLPVFQYIQTDAKHRGIEAELTAEIARLGETRLIFDGVADYTRVSLDGIGPAPRIPPLRLLGGLETAGPVWSLRVEGEWNAKQRRNAAFESETDDFFIANASASFKPFGRDRGVTLIASANNIFDVVGRRAASFTKDFVPVAGRDFRISARMSF